MCRRMTRLAYQGYPPSNAYHLSTGDLSCGCRISLQGCPPHRESPCGVTAHVLLRGSLRNLIQSFRVTPCCFSDKIITAIYVDRLWRTRINNHVIHKTFYCAEKLIFSYCFHLLSLFSFV
ncbi:hypothetical protein HSE2_gp017 [Escherichia phage vB_EcoS_HSE2]|nr:hypothetical protein HSE2_gp017 [Escherichia phage vB_EcoS_HSE2]